MTRFLAIGECMVEMSQEADGRYRLGFAGDTFNTAWYMRRLVKRDVEVAYLTSVGDDALSGKMAGFIREAGIVPELTVRAGGTVGLYMIALDKGERTFSYWRKTSAARQLVDGLDVLPGLSAGDIAYFSGITVAILSEDARAHLLSLLTRARDAGVRVVFDTNLRPALWQTPEAMRDWIMRAAGVADIVLPSHEDEATHFGDVDIGATATRYEEAGVPLVVVKNGGDDLLIREEGSDVTVTPEPVTEVVDTTAAGDSFNAGFLAALMSGATAESAARKGCHVARAVIGARGALVPV